LLQGIFLAFLTESPLRETLLDNWGFGESLCEADSPRNSVLKRGLKKRFLISEFLPDGESSSRDSP